MAFKLSSDRCNCFISAFLSATFTAPHFRSLVFVIASLASNEEVRDVRALIFVKQSCNVESVVGVDP